MKIFLYYFKVWNDISATPTPPSVDKPPAYRRLSIKKNITETVSALKIKVFLNFRISYPFLKRVKERYKILAYFVLYTIHMEIRNDFEIIWNVFFISSKLMILKSSRMAITLSSVRLEKFSDTLSLNLEFFNNDVMKEGT